jgi:site-specific recombinase XerC
MLNKLMQYTVEVGTLPANPLKAVKWTRPRTLETVDPHTVVDSDQVRRLLAAVGQQGERRERMVASFGCMYYAALRPEEAVELRPAESRQPPRPRLGRTDPDQFRAT